jgi:hypothetical protein
MPKKINTSDNENSFSIGRKTFFKTTKNIKNTPSNNSILPLNNSSSLRTHNIKLHTIGSVSTKITPDNNKIKYTSQDINLVYNKLSKIRGSGGYRPKY